MKKLTFLILVFINTTVLSQQKLSVYFDFNRHELTAATVQQLDSLLSAAKGLNGIELSGFCDVIGNHPYNDQLSLRRVASVKAYLTSKGITEDHFKNEVGFGKRKPVNENATADQRLLNRRVDILFNVETVVVEEVKPVNVPDTAPTITTQLEAKIKNNSLNPGDNIVLKNLNFIGGRHIVLPGSESLLDELLAVLKKYPTLKIEIQGHICCQYNGTDGLDFDTQTNDLSVNRARAVYAFLVKNGIDAERLSYKGFASTRPLFYPEKNEEEKTANRRVEIKIISK